MENSHNNIDQFYREKLSGYKQKLSRDGWDKMGWWLFWFNLRKYVLGFATLTMIGTIVYFGFFMNSQSAHKAVVSDVTFEEVSTVSTTDQAIIPSGSKPITDEVLIAEPSAENNKLALMPTVSHTKKSFPPPKNEITEVTVEDGMKSELFNSLSFIEARNSDLQNLTNSEADELLIDNTISPYHDIRKKSWISISLYAAPAYTASTLSSDNLFDDYLDYRNNHESGTISWSAGADIQFNFRNWYIQTGLSYSTFSDKRNGYEALDSINSYYNNDTIWGWVYDAPDFGKPIVLSIDTSFVPVYNDINEGTNEWKYFEIPLLLGYTFTVNRLSFDIGTGFSYGLLLSAKGNVPSFVEENLFTDLSRNEQSMNKHMFNYILQIGVSYHITPQWSLIVKPYYKQNLRSVFENNYPIDQRFKAFSIKFGLKVDL